MHTTRFRHQLRELHMCGIMGTWAQGSWVCETDKLKTWDDGYMRMMGM